MCYGEWRPIFSSVDQKYESINENCTIMTTVVTETIFLDTHFLTTLYLFVPFFSMNF